MDPSKFTSNAPGELVQIDDGDWAFVSSPLPAGWEFPTRLWPLLTDAMQQLGTLDGLGQNLPNPAILLGPLEDREAIDSSALEGTYASPRELLLFGLNPRDPASEKDPTNPWREVFNYRVALHEGQQADLPLSWRLIRDLHRTLLTGVRGRDRTPGLFRRGQVAIGSTRRFVPPPPHRMSECLDPLEKYLHATDSPYHPIVDCFLAHYQFETIHPFYDGNGRIGRLFLALMIQQRCRLQKPWLYLSGYFEKHRDQYTSGLFNISTDARWEEWISFCLQGVVEQADDAIQRCKRLLSIREEFHKRLAEIGGSVRLSAIVEDVFITPFIRIADLPARLGVTYPTAKADVMRLVTANILKSLEGERPATVYAPEVFRISYER